MTNEQTIMLAQMERVHGQVKRILDESEIAQNILEQCPTETRVYTCVNCTSIFTIEPTGDLVEWAKAG